MELSTDNVVMTIQGQDTVYQLDDELKRAELEKIRSERDFYTAQVRQINASIEHEAMAAMTASRNLDSFGVASETLGSFSFNSPVVDDFTVPFMNRLDGWSLRNPGKEITITFNSPGGSVFDGFALYDFIQELKRRGHRITTKCLGAAMSMGAVLLQAGDVRKMSCNAFFLIHEVQLFNSGTTSTSSTEDTLNLQRKLQRRIATQLAERSSLSAEEIEDKWRKYDWMMEAEEALELGFVDEIEK